MKLKLIHSSNPNKGCTSASITANSPLHYVYLEYKFTTPIGLTLNFVSPKTNKVVLACLQTKLVFPEFITTCLTILLRNILYSAPESNLQFILAFNWNYGLRGFGIISTNLINFSKIFFLFRPSEFEFASSISTRFIKKRIVRHEESFV